MHFSQYFKLTLIYNLVPLIDALVYLNALKLLDVPVVVYKRLYQGFLLLEFFFTPYIELSLSQSIVLKLGENRLT